MTDGLSDADRDCPHHRPARGAPPQLSTAPVVAFVHPQEDATLDVFAAVSNPTRRVLLLSDVVAHAEDGASLSVDAVGQNYLRVSGTTATGAPGRLGTVKYIVSDGTEDQGARVEGEATVYLLPPAPELAPIAVDDTVVVRAGAQIDIPVLENDIAPAGGRPRSIPPPSPRRATRRSPSPPATCCATSRPRAGRVQHRVLRLHDRRPGARGHSECPHPGARDEANRAPAARDARGSGPQRAVQVIEFDGFGMDPDGDVVTLDRIVKQPESGAATISADGASILYSSVPGYSGQVSFRYRVVDALGETGEGIVRIGVLDGESNPSPITFTDYVQVQAGEDNTIRVSPLSNDVDPTMGRSSSTECDRICPRR